MTASTNDQTMADDDLLDGEELEALDAGLDSVRPGEPDDEEDARRRQLRVVKSLRRDASFRDTIQFGLVRFFGALAILLGATANDRREPKRSSGAPSRNPSVARHDDVIEPVGKS